MTRVLVTGGSGFIGGHCIAQLLNQGHEVRTTIRSAAREKDVRDALNTAGIDPDRRLSFAIADLTQDAGWAEAVAGCDYVLHVASPLPTDEPEHEDDLIIPARQGTLRVLRAARDARVKRVVLTSSFGAVGYGHKPRKAPFTEADWTNVTGDDVSAYIKSKTLAERAAWDFIAREGDDLELSVINPVGVFGPVYSKDVSASIHLIKSMLEGAIPGCPQIYFGVVDVRDVADLHIRAMTDPAAKGERFLAVAGDSMSMVGIARILRRRLGPAASRVPRFQLPNWLVRLAALRNPQLLSVLPQLGKVRSSSNAKARQTLGWSPRPNEEVITVTGESLVESGILGSDKAA